MGTEAKPWDGLMRCQPGGPHIFTGEERCRCGLSEAPMVVDRKRYSEMEAALTSLRKDHARCTNLTNAEAHRIFQEARKQRERAEQAEQALAEATLRAERLAEALGRARIDHLYVDDDDYYSCELRSRYVSADIAKCSCGADRHNAAIDRVLGLGAGGATKGGDA